MKYSRYAVYVTLPKGPLADFGAAWLGWNAATGERPDAPLIDALPQPAHDITATPRKYGLHGTIKPPFRLAEGQDYAALSAALERFCASRPAVTLDGLVLSQLGSFLALTPSGDATALAQLAGETVRDLDGFRAPLTDEDLAKRRKARLTDRQDALLQAWGYPYVLEEFRFHITLSGRLTAEDAAQVSKALAPHLEPLLPRPYVIDALTLCGEDLSGNFHELRRFALTG